MIKDNFASGLTFEELKATYPQHGLIYLSWHPALEQQLRLNGSDSMYLADFIHVNEMNDQAAYTLNSDTETFIDRSLAEVEFKYFRIESDLLEQLIVRQNRTKNFVISPVTGSKNPVKIEMSYYTFDEIGNTTGVYLVLRSNDDAGKFAKRVSGEKKFMAAMAELEEVLMTGSNIEEILFDSTLTHDQIDVAANYSSFRVEKTPFFI